MLAISIDTARRFILGKQGLWPGRRWRVVMRRERDGTSGDLRIHRMAAEHADAIAEMRAILRERGTVSNRDFEMASRTRTQSYRGRKDSALALYYLWRIGEVMTHHRENFERVYALTETVAPASLLRESDETEADRFLIRKEVSFFGLSPIRRTADAFHGRGEPDRAARKLLGAMVADGDLIEVRVEGWRMGHYALGSDAEVLAEVSTGRVPQAWTPLETTTTEEVVFLSPLDHVSARGRAKAVFGFDYVWEVYKPLDQRRFGYYTLPILWGDRLVGRFDSKLDRTTNTFVILGLWLEEEALGIDEAFAEALACGFARFVRFLGASRLDATAIREPLLRRRFCSSGETE